MTDENPLWIEFYGGQGGAAAGIAAAGLPGDLRGH